MYGNKVWITGITIILAVSVFAGSIATLSVAALGGLVAIAGAVLIWFDK